MSKHKLLTIGLIIITLTAGLFRFYRLEALLHISLDEEYWSYLTERVIMHGHYPLIGGEISSTKLFTGPLFVYVTVPFYMLSHLNPAVAGYVWSFVGVLTCLLVYVCGTAWFKKRVGLLAALLYATSFSMALHDRRFWNVTPIPFVSLFSAWCVHRIIKGDHKALIWLALATSFGLHAHFSAVAPIFGALMALWFASRSASPAMHLPKKTVWIALGIFFLLNVAPLIAFDLRHNFWHVKAVKQLAESFTQAKKPESNANLSGIKTNLFRSLGSLVFLGPHIDVAEEMSHCQAIIDTRPQPPLWAQLIGVSVFVWMILWCFRKRGKPLAIFLSSVIIVNIIGLFVYRERVFTYHFAPIMPFFFIFLSKLIWKIARRFSYLAVVALVTGYLMLNTHALLTAKSDMGFLVKSAMVKTIISETKGQAISVHFIPSCEMWGLRYLFTAYGKPVVKSSEDEILGWLYPEDAGSHIDTEVIIAVPDAGRTKDYPQKIRSLINPATKEITVNHTSIFFSPAK